MSTQFLLEVPATSANLGPGYDSCGIALDLLDTLRLSLHESAVDPGDCVSAVGEGAENLPRDRSHLIMRVLLEVLATEYPELPSEVGARLSLDCHNRIPHSRGLGSSAAAVVAGIGLAGAVGEHLSGRSLHRQRVLELAAAYEGHPDNAAPAVFGGMTVSVCDPVRSWQVPVDTLRTVTVLIPDARLDTEIARSVIPPTIPHISAAENSARTGLLVLGLLKDRSALFAATADRLHQEFRRAAYPESMELVDRLRTAGLPAVISGAGPTVLVLSETIEQVPIEPGVRILHPALNLDGYSIRRLDSPDR